LLPYFGTFTCHNGFITSPTSESCNELFCNIAVNGHKYAPPSCASKSFLISPSGLNTDALTSYIIAPLKVGAIPVKVFYK